MSDLTSWREFLDARILQEKGRDEDALVILERLCDAFPRNPAFLRAKAYSLSAVNREEDAASSVVAAVVSTYAMHHFPDDDKVALIHDVMRLAPWPDPRMFLVDYAFRDAAERASLLGAQARRGRHHVVAEIESEHYARLDRLSERLAALGLALRQERNGIWDWRLEVRARG